MRIVLVAVCHLDCRHDMSLYADHGVNLEIIAGVLFMSVFGAVMAIEALDAEAGRVNREVRFDQLR